MNSMKVCTLSTNDLDPLDCSGWFIEIQFTLDFFFFWWFACRPGVLSENIPHLCLLYGNFLKIVHSILSAL